MDRGRSQLVDALRNGVDQAEVRLYRAGKLPGLFGGRTAANAELAKSAQEKGLIEILRTETKGKSPIEWVRVTSAGAAFVLESESPVRALHELRAVLEVNRDGLPHWLGDLQTRIDELGQHLADEVSALRGKIDAMMVRVQSALAHAERSTGDGTSWTRAAIEYLERRKSAGFEPACPLSELFVHARSKDAALSIRDFHSGLRRLHDRGLVKLTAATHSTEPEYALLEGSNVYDHAAAA